MEPIRYVLRTKALSNQRQATQELLVQVVGIGTMVTLQTLMFPQH